MTALPLLAALASCLAGPGRAGRAGGAGGAGATPGAESGRAARGAATPRGGARPEPEAVDIEPVWAGHPVGFALLTRGERQFVGYCDAERRMTVASRRLGSGDWTFRKLPSRLGWDSHNYVTMALDMTPGDEGYLHVAGNMHCVPLVYFRTTKPYDVATLERVPVMVDGSKERRVTYPRFFRGGRGELIFRYRDGGSGRGNDHYNVYDPAGRSWRALLDHPLLDGRGKVNGYFALPRLGPDGLFHIVGVWRDTPDAATNHHPSYARSPDLVRWETAAGRPLATPLTVDNIDVVDPVPPRAGLINGNCKLGFDSMKRPVVSYHKYDAKGNSQIYCARFEGGHQDRAAPSEPPNLPVDDRSSASRTPSPTLNGLAGRSRRRSEVLIGRSRRTVETEGGRWVVRQVSDWEGYRWSFGGGGSIPFEVRVGGVKPIAGGRLALGYRNKRGGGAWALDEETLEVVGAAPAKRKWRSPPGYRRLESDFPGMAKRHAGDLGKSGAPGVRYELAWETLGRNRDRPRRGELPAPSMLRVCRLVEEGP